MWDGSADAILHEKLDAGKNGEHIAYDLASA
jgi:hypothetical protein